MISNFRKTVESMTYRDMVDLSNMLSSQLADDAESIANALLNLPADAEDGQIQGTNKVLSQVFSRKKQITIQPHNNGSFKISCPTMEGAVVFDKNIREGVSQLLDTIAVLEVFNG